MKRMRSFCMYLVWKHLHEIFSGGKAKCETVCIVKHYDVEAMLVVKNILANKEDAREAGSIPGSRRLPGVEEWQSTSVFLPG